MSVRSWPEVLAVLADGGDLAADDTAWAMDEIMSDNATTAQIAAFGLAMKIKGPTRAELIGLATGMLEHARRVRIDGDAVDIVGTGGDRSGSVNISTMSSIVVAAAGAPVVKHGNRAQSSKSGGADVLEELGVRLTLGPEAVARCVREAGIGFCFAAVFHPALRYAGAARREIGVPTVFNVLGPLTNPAQPRAGLVGCAFGDLLPVLAEVFAERGVSALVVRGNDGLDEITTTDTTDAWVVSGGRMRRTTIDPTRIGIPRADPDALVGGDAAVNATVAREVFAGGGGAARDAVVLNSAAALVAYDWSRGHGDPDADLHGALAATMARAADAIDTGKAAALLEHWAQLTHRLGSD
ncbi:anthranilate phosphoribosyltransferase [Nocardia sp. CNY236]|uniref:anthranilate phosphoribosyltransferase n=1 Tax=Nocardia sp. CNY236 TaxID=1169152 RepID=UPI00040EEBD7|nr:anthranilate phosphoribosyltransferase [Nocardia sp. CNY236]